MKTHLKNGLCSLALGTFLVGCGGDKTTDAPPVPPPSAPPADVSVTSTTDASVAPPAAPNQPPPPPGEGAPIPAQETGPVDKFKGMSQREIDEFKANATPETHDMNLGPLIEAINGYHGEFRRYPASQEEMVKARYLPRVLFAPKGKKYVINPQTGEVTVQ